MRTIFNISALGALFLAGPLRAADFELQILASNGTSAITVDASCPNVSYFIVGRVTGAANDGLALWTCDLQATGIAAVTLTPLTRPAQFSDLAYFDFPLGIANPPSPPVGSGYGGTPDPANSSVLLGLGGATNTIRNPGSAPTPYPNSSTVPGGFALSGKRILAQGSVTLPAAAGAYTLAAINVSANVIRSGELSLSNPVFWKTERVAMVTTTDLAITVTSAGNQTSIVAANPPLPGANPYRPGTPFRDVLDTGTTQALTAGIGGAGTAPQGPIGYAPLLVTFGCTPNPAPTTANISVSCTAGPCPTVTSVTGSGVGPYSISLSAPIPPGQCTTFTFAGTVPGEKLQYQSLPGDVNLDAFGTNTQDLLFLVSRINDGTANLPENLARYNVDRIQAVNTQDLLREVQLLNGTNTTQVWNGVTVAACP